jgi:uncharacterized membrane protein
MSHWQRHPGVRSGDELTRGEKAADYLRNAMGSWPFVFTFLLIMVLWAIGNTIVIGRVLSHKAFDPFPYVFLNLFLSMLAGLQGAILLIAAKRADSIAAEQSTHHLEVTESLVDLLHLNTDITNEVRADTALLHEIHKHLTAISPNAGDFEPNA